MPCAGPERETRRAALNVSASKAAQQTAAWRIECFDIARPVLQRRAVVRPETEARLVVGFVIAICLALAAFVVHALRGVRNDENFAHVLAAALQPYESTVGKVRVAGDEELALLDGELRLSITQLPTERQRAHFHVRARWTGSPRSNPEACLMGVGPDERAQFANAQLVFIENILPPLLSIVRKTPLLSATPFHGTEAWSVPDRRGYSVGYSPGGSPGPELNDIPPFTGLTPPADGLLHIAKVVLLAENGHWLRTIEIDGQATPIVDQVWAEASVNGVLALQFAAFEAHDAIEDEARRRAALVEVERGPAWLPLEDPCPADLLPASFRSESYSIEACRGGRLRDCLDECRRGSAVSCYGAALGAQREPVRAAGVQKLFLEACRLGFASGCTNGAAGRLLGAPMDDCSFRTFDAVCTRARDPWACTMFGRELLHGVASRRDLGRVRAVLVDSCPEAAASDRGNAVGDEADAGKDGDAVGEADFGGEADARDDASARGEGAQAFATGAEEAIEDPACTAAKRLLEELDGIESAAAESPRTP